MQARGSTIVACSPEAAFAFVSNPANDARWRSHLVSSRGQVRGLGDSVTQTFSYDGHSKAITLEVSEYEPPARLAYVLHDPVRVRMAFQFRAEGEGTRVSLTFSSALTGPAALFESRIQAEADKLIRTDLGRLKVACQSAG